MESSHPPIPIDQQSLVALVVLCPGPQGLGDRLVLLFSGVLAGNRGLDTLLDAMASLQTRAPDPFALVVVGEGPVRGELEAQSRRLGLEQTVRFTGWVDYLKLPDIIVRADRAHTTITGATSWAITRFATGELCPSHLMKRSMP